MYIRYVWITYIVLQITTLSLQASYLKKPASPRSIFNITKSPSQPNSTTTSPENISKSKHSPIERRDSNPRTLTGLPDTLLRRNANVNLKMLKSHSDSLKTIHYHEDGTTTKEIIEPYNTTLSMFIFNFLEKTPYIGIERCKQLWITLENSNDPQDQEKINNLKTLLARTHSGSRPEVTAATMLLEELSLQALVQASREEHRPIETAYQTHIDNNHSILMSLIIKKQANNVD